MRKPPVRRLAIPGIVLTAGCVAIRFTSPPLSDSGIIVMPFAERPVPVEAHCGFPSPAQDFAEKQGLSLDRLVIKHPAATFFMRSSGNSMSSAGIGDGDLLVVDRSLTPCADDIVVAVVDGGFTCKRVVKTSTGFALASEGQGPTMAIDPDQGVEIWGVVSWIVKEVRR